MKLIFTPNPDEPYNLIQITPNWDLLSDYDNDEAKVLNRVIERNKTVGQIAVDAPYWIVDSDEVPTDHYFFEAWEYRDNSVRVNMVKARNIHLTNIRQARNAKLALLDIPFIRAIESGDNDEIKRITTEKQVLRDIPQTLNLDAYDDTDTLKSVWPEVL